LWQAPAIMRTAINISTDTRARDMSSILVKSPYWGERDQSG
jgi:hypothetical protein